jgi:hypothetical protein
LIAVYRRLSPAPAVAAFHATGVSSLDLDLDLDLDLALTAAKF